MARTRTNEVEKLKAELADMGRRLMELTGDTVDDMEESTSSFANAARDIMGEKWSQAKHFGQKTADRAQGYAEENPWQMLAAGVAVGMALAFFLKRDRD